MERPNAWKGYTKKDVKELNSLFFSDIKYEIVKVQY